LAWIGLVPFLLALDGQPLLDRVKLAVIFSFLFFSLLVSWLLPLNFLGYLGFILVLMIAPVLFAVLFLRPFHNKRVGIVYCPALWVATEFFRTNLLGGFAWTLGHSQSFQLTALQMAGLTGSYGLSFFLVMFNYCLYQLWKNEGNQYFYAACAFGAVFVLFGYGHFAFMDVQQSHQPTHFYEIGAIQPNISPQEKWDEHRIDKIIDKHIAVTKLCLQTRPPDMIVWPETAIPDDFIKDLSMREKISQIATQVKTHLLLGAALFENGRDYNSAVLLNGRGAVLDIYRKKYLIPFSEFLPFKQYLGFLRSSLNFNIYDFSPGKSLGIFTIRQKTDDHQGYLEEKFGVAICSEGSYPTLFRKLTLKESGFIVVLLNDAWFQQEAAMIMHAQSEIFRAVENRVSIVRVANSGWSCVIDPYGGIRPLTNKKPKLNKAGFYLFYVEANHATTFYNKYGDIFAVTCLGFVIINFVLEAILFFRKKRPE